MKKTKNDLQRLKHSGMLLGPVWKITGCGLIVRPFVSNVPRPLLIFCPENDCASARARILSPFSPIWLSVPALKIGSCVGWVPTHQFPANWPSRLLLQRNRAGPFLPIFQTQQTRISPDPRHRILPTLGSLCRSVCRHRCHETRYTP